MAALRPKTMLLYPPHDKFHEMMGVTSSPWAEFRRATIERFPAIDLDIAGPGFEWRVDGSVSSFPAAA